MHCSGLAPELLESELFGHAPGAFPGAAQARDGLFHYAQGGTLFLDEVAELPLSVQASLLRVLEERQVRPMGSQQKSPVDVRIVAASARDLSQEVAAGRFRKDLYYRLQVVEIALPPLREHKHDLGLLFEHFVRLLAPQLGAAPLALSEEELAYLRQYDWPGNVRELRNFVERSLILGKLNVTALYQAPDAGCERNKPAQGCHHAAPGHHRPADAGEAAHPERARLGGRRQGPRGGTARHLAAHAGAAGRGVGQRGLTPR